MGRGSGLQHWCWVVEFQVFAVQKISTVGIVNRRKADCATTGGPKLVQAVACGAGQLGAEAKKSGKHKAADEMAQHTPRDASAYIAHTLTPESTTR